MNNITTCPLCDRLKLHMDDNYFLFIFKIKIIDPSHMDYTVLIVSTLVHVLSSVATTNCVDNIGSC